MPPETERLYMREMNQNDCKALQGRGNAPRPLRDYPVTEKTFPAREAAAKIHGKNPGENKIHYCQTEKSMVL